MALRKKTIRLPIYKASITFIETGSLKELKDKFGIDEGWGKIFGHSFCMEDDEHNLSCNVFILLNVNDKELSPGDVAHECVHTANTIFNLRKMKLDVDNDEPYAYLVSWLVDECYKFFEFKF